MPKIYLCPEGPNRICTIISKEDADSLIRKDPDWDAYVLDVEKYVPTPPKEDLWTVVDRQGAALHKHFMCGVKVPGPLAITFSHMDEAIMLRDILERNGMTGLAVRRIWEDE